MKGVPVSPRELVALSPQLSPRGPSSRGSTLARKSIGRNANSFIPGLGLGRRSVGPSLSPPISPRGMGPWSGTSLTRRSFNGGGTGAVSGGSRLGAASSHLQDGYSEASGVLSGVLQSLTRDVADSIAFQSMNDDLQVGFFILPTFLTCQA